MNLPKPVVILLLDINKSTTTVTLEYGRDLGSYTASKGSSNERTVTLPISLKSSAGIVSVARSNGFIAHVIGLAEENTKITIRLYNAAATGTTCNGFFWNLIGY